MVCHFLWRRWWPFLYVQLYQFDLLYKGKTTENKAKKKDKCVQNPPTTFITENLLNKTFFLLLSLGAFSRKRNALTNTTAEERLTNSVDVLDSTSGEVVVEYKINSLKVDSSGKQSCADQNPNLSWTKTVHNVISLVGKSKWSNKPRSSLNT